MGLGLTCAMSTNCSASFSAFTTRRSMKERASGSRSCRGSSTATVDGFGLKLFQTRERHFILPSLKRRTRMRTMHEADILIVDDSPADAELTMRALKRNHEHARIFL